MEGSDGGSGEAEEHSEGVEALVCDPEIAGAVGEKAVGEAEVSVQTVAPGGVDAGSGREGGANREGVVDAGEFGDGAVVPVDEPNVLGSVDGDGLRMVDAAGGEA